MGQFRKKKRAKREGTVIWVIYLSEDKSDRETLSLWA